MTVPSRKNQQIQVDFSPYKRKNRKRIETLISQLDGQFSMDRNYAKTLEGLDTRMLSKITAVTIVQYLNLYLYKYFAEELKK
ncbi:MAG: hypothetical protein PHI32_07155 [Dysgonamonadaceae bacterium]|nr:hypothetical protein [Dysgonamonadaceae bacterium]